MQLVYRSEDLLHENILQSLYLRGRLNIDAKADLDKLKQCREEGLNIDDVFVPNFNDNKEALSALNIGDVCQIKDKKYISIKVGEDKIKNLSISKDKYMELFPPVERFSVMQSKEVGDCWLLATLDSIYSNPKTRSIILSVFQENENGGIDINFGEFKNNNEITIKNADKYTAQRVFSPKGFACIEEALEQKRAHMGYERIMNLYNSLKYDKPKHGRIKYDGAIYTKSDIETVTAIIETYIDRPLDMQKSLIDLKSKDACIKLDRKKILNYLNYFNSEEALKKFSSYEIRGIKRMLISNLNKLEKSKDKVITPKEIMPTRAYLKFSFMDMGYEADNDLIYEMMLTPYINGGYPEEAYEVFGMDSSKATSDNLNGCFEDSAILVADTDNKKKNYYGLGYKIYKNHGYMIKPLPAYKKQKFGIRDPHNASQELVMSLDKLMKVFTDITIGKEKK